MKPKVLNLKTWLASPFKNKQKNPEFALPGNSLIKPKLFMKPENDLPTMPHLNAGLRSLLPTLIQSLLPTCMLLLALETLQANPQNPHKKPNIIIILTDDQGYRDTGCYGCKDFKTPHIDSLAASGVKFTQGYVTHPYCSPSRAGILSGRYQQSFGHEHNPRYDEDNLTIGIDIKTPLMPTYFKQSGYRTAAIGKWHVGEGQPFRPITRGFDHFWGFLGGGHDYWKVKANGTNYSSPIWIDQTPSGTQLSYLTDDLTDAAIRFIQKKESEPFLIYLAYNAPHSPNQAKPADLKRNAGIQHQGRRRYAAMMTAVDDNVGRIIDTLEQNQLRENTLIFYLSDNGGRKALADNRPLRGNKGWLYEGGIRVPFILSYPAKIKAGQVNHQPISSLDILPTSLSAIKRQPAQKLDGMNILDLIKEDHKPTQRTLHWRCSGGDGFALRQGAWKLIRDVYHTEPELYNLSLDPEERKNLAKQYPEKLKQLLDLHKQWNLTLEKPRWNEGHTKGTRIEWQTAKPNGYRVYGKAWWLNEEPKRPAPIK